MDKFIMAAWRGMDLELDMYARVPHEYPTEINGRETTPAPKERDRQLSHSVSRVRFTSLAAARGRVAMAYRHAARKRIQMGKKQG